jgi:hypothetical protein
MRPPACVSCKWGTGTTCERPTNSVASKELDAKLKEMMAARSQQDTMWVAPPKQDSQAFMNSQEKMKKNLNSSTS